MFLRIITLIFLACVTTEAQVQSFPTVVNLPVTCNVGDVAFKTVGGLYYCGSSNTWSSSGGSGGGIPSGLITFVISGACPTGFTEDSSLVGKTLFGTSTANGNIGTTGGSDTITPTINSLTAAAQVFSGSSTNTSLVSAGTPTGTNSTSTVTPLGSNATGTVTATGTINTPTISWPVGVPLFSGVAHAHELPWQIASTTTIRQIAVATFGTGTSRAATAVSAAGTANTTSAAVALTQSVTDTGTVAWPAGVPTSNSLTFTGSSATTSAQTFTGSSSTVGAQTFSGSLLGTHQHTITATGSNGTSTVTGTLNNFDNRSAFTRVIFCVAN